jgi:rod shape-determining protein MreC
MVMDYRYHKLDAVRYLGGKLLNPVRYVLNWPFNGYQQLSVYLESKHSLLLENQQLHTDNLQLSALTQKLAALELENRQMQALLQTSHQLKEVFVAAKVINFEILPFKHAFTINRGAEHGVFSGQPIIDANGLIGAVKTVYPHTSEALFITDPNFAIPIENLRSGVRTLAIGNGNLQTLELQHVTNTADIAVGDVLVTSGFGGRYKFGYPVGTVSSVENDPAMPFANIHLKIKADLLRCREVLLLGNQENAEQEKSTNETHQQ